jgi:hypothetical protein
VRAVVEVVWDFGFHIRFSFSSFGFRLGSRDDGLCLRKGAGGFKRRNLLQREYLVPLDCDPQTVGSVLLRLDTYDRALEHYGGLRNLCDDDEALPQLGGTLAQHVEAARAEIFENRVDAELLAVRREVESDCREGAAYARFAAAFDYTKVFQ